MRTRYQILLELSWIGCYYFVWALEFFVHDVAMLKRINFRFGVLNAE